MAAGSNRFKKMAYDYDLISGKVNEVVYQPDMPDASQPDGIKRFADKFHHRYLYDAENRITDVLTSRDGIYWERDATYQYYQHGPLSRTELGQLKVQGVDYVYTLQGWLKMINPTVAQTGGDNDNGQGCEPGTGVGNIIVNKREDNTPPGYAATGEITFEEGFEKRCGGLF